MIANAVLSLRIHFICFPALGVLFVLRTNLQAIGRKIIPIISSSFELVVKVITGMWLIPMFGYLIVCLAEPVIWIVCAVFIIIAYTIQRPFTNATEDEYKIMEEKTYD